MLAGLKSAFGFGNEQKANALNEQLALTLLDIRSTASNIHVGPTNAMEVPAVNCAIGIISEKTGDTPFKLYKSDTRETARDHPAYKLIHDEADAFTSAAQFRINLSVDAMLHDNGHAHVIRSSDDRPIALQRLEPGTVQNRTEDDGTPYYVVSENRGQRRYEFTDILHIQPLGGKAPIKTAREAIALAIAFERHMAGLLANGGRPSGIILAKKRLDPDPKQKIADSWFSTHGGKNAGGTAILDEEMTYQQIATTLADAQFAENRLEQIREIGRAFRIPPTMLFELTRGTWSNTEEMARQFYTVTLKPWLTAWTWAYSRVLLTPEERDQFYIEPVLDDLLTTDFAKKATAFGQYRSMGVYTGNEVRRMLNMPPHPDGDSLSNPHITTTTTGPAPTAPKEAA
ncbi:phage portal protein [Rhizobium laguerreae]|uniref:phage portal protein n=1 Tax=Rhizobium laguerreae TaxID=1076926 RepID=UPI001C92ABDE|nr:phage portal protein [Rhizobium laguerreae]MBY3070757.1 phage portal protein [Rhizobium laguerreae]